MKGDDIHLTNFSDPNSIENSLRLFGEDPFLLLQIERFLSISSPKYKTDAIKTISRVAKSLSELDAASRTSYLSSETSLLRRVGNIWQQSKSEQEDAFVIDDYISNNFSRKKHELFVALQRAWDGKDVTWQLDFIIYAEKFGFDEFLDIISYSYLTAISSSVNVSSLDAKMLGLILRNELDACLTRDSRPDKLVSEVCEELLEDHRYIALSSWQPPLSELLLEIAHSPLGHKLITGWRRRPGVIQAPQRSHR